MANTPGFNDVMGNMTDAKDAVADSAREAGRSLAEQVDKSRETAAGGLGKAAAAIRNSADHIPGVKTLANSARTTANSLDSAADYVRSHDANGMMSDVHGVVRRNPGTALLVAAAFGFVVAKLFSHSE